MMDRPKRSRPSSAESVAIFPEQLRIGDRAVRVLAQKALVSIRKQDMARAIERVAEQGFMGPTGVVLILTAERPREAAEPAKVSKVSRRGTVRATAEEVERAVQEAVDERNA